MDTDTTQNITTTDTEASQPDTSSQKTGRSLMLSLKRALMNISTSKKALSGIAVFVGVLAIAGTLAATGIINVRALGEFTNITGAPARVNGVAIDAGLLAREMESLATRYGLDPKSDTYKNAEADIRDAALDNLITTELLSQAADARGFTASAEEVMKEKQTMIDALGGEETFNTQLAAAGFTPTLFEEYVAKDVAIRKLLDAEVPAKDISVTDEAVRGLYKEIYENMEDAPSLKEVEASLKEQLVNKELEKRYTVYIESLKANARIEK